MAFVPPTWVEGLAVQLVMYVVIPLIVALAIGAIAWIKTKDIAAGALVFGVAMGILMVIAYPIGCVYWYDNYEVPSVQEKIITIQGYEPVPGIMTNEEGNIVIDNADQWLIVTTNGSYLNEENFFFGKYDTRDIIQKLKIGGTYRIKYYGWREGRTSSFPNILSVEEVINETGAKEFKNYYGTQVSGFS